MGQLRSTKAKLKGIPTPSTVATPAAYRVEHGVLTNSTEIRHCSEGELAILAFTWGL